MEDTARSTTPGSGYRADSQQPPGATTPPTAMGNQSTLAAATWEALGEAGGAFDRASPGALSSAQGDSPPDMSSTPLAGLGPGAAVSSAKLRASKSANSSRVDLSSGYFGGRSPSAGSAADG